MLDLEIRSLPFTLDSSGNLTVRGLVNGSGSISQVLRNAQGAPFQETIAPGVFQKAIDECVSFGGRVDFLYEHDTQAILATTENQSLTLSEDERGLDMSASISPTSWGKDAYQLIIDGIIKGMSFGMQVLEDTWEMRDSGIPLRTISAINLFEVSAVRNPAYLTSAIEARGINQITNVQIPENLESEIKMAEKRNISSEDKDSIQKQLDALKATINNIAKDVKPAEPADETPAPEVVPAPEVPSVGDEVRAMTANLAGVIEKLSLVIDGFATEIRSDDDGDLSEEERKKKELEKEKAADEGKEKMPADAKKTDEKVPAEDAKIPADKDKDANKDAETAKKMEEKEPADKEKAKEEDEKKKEKRSQDAELFDFFSKTFED